MNPRSTLAKLNRLASYVVTAEVADLTCEECYEHLLETPAQDSTARELTLWLETMLNHKELTCHDIPVGVFIAIRVSVASPRPDHRQALAVHSDTRDFFDLPEPPSPGLETSRISA